MKDDMIDKMNTRPWELLRAVTHFMHLAHDKELEILKLTTRQVVTLGMIKRMGSNVKPADLSRRLARKPSSVSNILSRMENRGLISRVPDPENKRQKCISLTDLGEQKYLEAKKRVVIKRILSVLSESQVNRLTADLVKLRDSALSELGYNPKKRKLPWD